MRIEMSILLYTLILVLFLSIASPTSIEKTIGKLDESFSLSPYNSEIAYVQHDPIVITDNTGFLTTGFSGYGNATHPYMLKDINITYDGDCISISNTSVYFVINNCILKSSSKETDSGILLDNVTNGLVESCTIFFKRIGVELKNSITCSIHNNAIYDNSIYGVSLWESENCALNNNTIYGGDRGVHIESSSDIDFLNDTILMTSSDCIDIFNVQNCSIINSTLNSVQVVGAPNFIMINNNVLGRVHIHLSDNSTLTLNEIYGNNALGLFLEESKGCLITHNNVHSNFPIGVFLDSHSSNNTIFDNTIGWNTYVNALDNGTNNIWDDSASIGNAWGDFNGTGTYMIPGSAGSIDRYPKKADTTSPTCTVLEDFEYEMGSTGNSIVWTPSDEHPKSFFVLRNGLVIESGDWNGTNIIVLIDGLNLGMYNFTLLAYDTCYNLVMDDVFVTVVDTTAPICDKPPDIEYEAGTISNCITWTPLDFNPYTYQVFRNGSIIVSGNWNGSKIEINIDGLNPGVYNYTLCVFDVFGKYTNDVVFVIVIDTTPPTIDIPLDITYEIGVTGNLITWHPSDLYPIYYEILRNGTRVRSGGWDGSLIEISVDGLSVGVHNYTLMISDTSGNWVADTVIVTVTSLAGTDFINPMMITMFASGGFIAVVIIVFLFKRKQKMLQPITPEVIDVKSFRGCEIIGGKFHYKAKVKNESDYVITDVNVSILAYPRDCLKIEGNSVKRLERIEPSGFRSPEFIFAPTKDCVEGQILATVSYVDHENRVRTLDVEPYTIRSVCDLLRPLEATLQEFDLMLGDMAATSEEHTVDWNPEFLVSKTEVLLPTKNFQIIESKGEVVNGEYKGVIRGLAEGKYTGKRVAIRIAITGDPESNQSSVVLEGLGDDEAMLPITIHELAEGIVGWICLNCGAGLEPNEVMKVKSGGFVQCRYCGHTLTIDLYKK